MFLGQYPHISGHRSLDTLVQIWESDMFKGLKEGGYHVAHLSPRGHLYADVETTDQAVHEYGFLVEPGAKDPWRAMRALATAERSWARLFYLGGRELDDGFDFDEAVTRGAVEWLQNPPQEPFCLFLPLIWPHCPFEAEEPYFSMYDRMPEPVSVDSKTGYESMYMKTLREEYGITNTTKQTWAEICATYYGMISRLDDQFGRIMKVVEDKGMWDSTVTMFFTDHGEYLGDHGLIEKWPSGLSDSLVKEPLVIGGAGIPEGVVIDEMAEMVDLLPTVMELCNVKETFPHNGKSLMPLINKVPGYQHKEVRLLRGRLPAGRRMAAGAGRLPLRPQVQPAARQDRDRRQGHGLPRPRVDLHPPPLRAVRAVNRRDDPGERHNLSGKLQYAHVEAKYREIVFRWLVETADLLPWGKGGFFGRPAGMKSTPPAEQFARRKGEARDHPMRQ